MIIDRLYDAVLRRGPVCVGLDTSERLLPARLRAAPCLSEAILEFNRAVIDATLDVTACYKVQIAHYEALGVEGLACYRDTLAYVRKNGGLVIGDVKRGDIASTGEMYARAHFTGDFEADFVTLNPYMGGDVIAPFEPHLKEGNKGLFALVKTSNPSSADIQDLRVGAQPVYMHVAQKLTVWGQPYCGAHGYSAIGAVVGATQMEQLVALRRGFPSLFFLVPGYGAQGGGGRDVAPAFVDGNGAVVNASRLILGAHRDQPDGDDRYVEYARQAVVQMREDISQWMGR
jgi:orotidine-5'-phosphate decarboxylase